MPRRSANFTPPPRRPEASPAITLFVEPEDPIRVMGEMIRDADLVQEKLRGLAFADEHYRADLRVIRGVAVRTADRCARLLDEIEPKERPAPDPSAGFHRAAVEAIGEDVAGPGPEPPEPENPPSKRPARRTTGPTRPASKPRPNRERNLGSPAAVPVPAGVRASILKHLAKGPYTSADLHEKIGGLSNTIYSTLSAMRSEGLVEMRVDEEDGQRKNYLTDLADQAASA